jgi:hypothetical protein
MFAPKVSTVHAGLRPLTRAVVYGVAGCVGELFFTACTSALRTHRLRPHTSPLMLPVYALIQPLFEPAHQIMRGRVPLWGRAVGLLRRPLAARWPDPVRLLPAMGGWPG